MVGKKCPEDNVTYYYVIIDVDGVPADADFLIEGRFRKMSRDWCAVGDDAGRKAFEDAAPSTLHCNGSLASFMFGHTLEIKGTVTVYGAPAVHARSTSFGCGPRLNALRQTGTFCDAVLTVGGNKFPVHRSMLAIGSPVFLAMFSGDFKESASHNVDITGDYSTAVFEKFLEYMYTGVMSDCSYGELVDLMELGHIYLVDGLVDDCKRRLLKCGADSALTVLQAALEKPFMPENVLSRAIKVALDNWETVVGSSEWAEFEAEHPTASRMLKGTKGTVPSLPSVTRI